MKATFFYSEEQKRLREATPLPRTFVFGKEYTGLATHEGDHRSAFEDAEIVATYTGLPINEPHLNRYEQRIANLSSLILTTGI